MCVKVMNEWKLAVPWGKLAMLSWGDPGKPPVLLIHGYSDTAATFIPMVNLLPDTYYYVAFDLPGHGLSQPAPGPPVSYLHFVDCIRLTVDHLQWSTFMCIVHSMAYLISCCYNAAFPGRMSRLVNLDGSIFAGWHCMTDYPEIWFRHCYASCYDRFYPPPKPATYSYDEAISLIMRSRSVSAELAASLATRCLEPYGDGTFRFTWDPKIKKISTTLFTFDTLYAVLAKNIPTLNIVASDDMSIEMFRTYTAKMMAKLRSEMTNYYILKVEGGHDVHLNNPEQFVENIVEFLEKDFNIKSKL